MNAAAGADKESMQVTVPASNGARMSAGDVLDALEKSMERVGARARADDYGHS